jgi:hypothetical protein
MKDRSSSFCHQPTKIMDCRLASVPFYSRMTAMPSTSARRQGTAPHAAPKICSLTLMACHWRDLAPHSAVRGSHSIAHGPFTTVQGITMSVCPYAYRGAGTAVHAPRRAELPPEFGDGEAQRIEVSPGFVTITFKRIPDDFASWATEGFRLEKGRQS